MFRLTLALVLAITLPIHAASQEENIAKVFEMLYAVSDAAAIVESLGSGGRTPDIKGAAGLSRAKFGDDGMVEFLVDPWGTPLHIESSPGKGYVIAAAGSDRTFDRSTWSTPAKTASSTDDVVLRDGELVRSPEEWAWAAANLTSERLQAQRSRSNHAQTIGNLRAIASAVLTYQMVEGKLPPAEDLDALANALEPEYTPKLLRTDGWGHEVRIAKLSTVDAYRIASAGADGKHGTTDDIVFQDEEVVKGGELPAGDDIVAAWVGFKAAQLRLKEARAESR